MANEDEDASKQIAIRLPVALLERLKAHTSRLRRRNRGLTVTRAETIRVLLNEALDAAEAGGAGPTGEQGTPS